MRLGLFTSPDTVGQRTVAELVALAVRAERSGLAGMWLVQLATSGQEVLTTLALAGQQTTRLELGTAVIPIYGRHPLLLAQQAATAQAATGGRLTLGLGVSHQPVVEGVLGLRDTHPARDMREYLTVLQRLLRGERVDHTGPAYNVHATLQVPGAAPGPLLIAALAPRMLAVAGELADGTITWMAGRHTVATHIVPRINRAAEAAGRPRPRVCVALPVVVTDDAAAARAAVDRTLARYGQLENYRRLLDIEGAAGPAEVAVIGTEAEVAAQLAALAAAGATDFLAAIPAIEGAEGRTWALLERLGEGKQRTRDAED